MAEESAAGVDAAANPDVFTYGYYVRAPGYVAEESAARIIDVAATPYLKSSGSTSSDAVKMVSASSESQLIVANDPVLGNILVDGRGFTLYMFTKDEAGKSNCTGGCLQVWPPLCVRQ